MIFCNEKLVIQKANKSVCDLFGMCESELRGKRLDEVFSFAGDTVLQAVATTGERIQLENRKLQVRGNRDPLYADIASWPSKEPDGSIKGICLSVIEVTRRYATDRQKEEFIAALVHDLKTPLIGADRTIEAMLQGAVGPVDPQHEKILTILRNSNRSLVTMVQSLIDVYRCQNDLLNLSLQTVSLTDLVSQSISELSMLFATQGVVLTHNLSSDSGAGRILGDRLALRRVVNNLLDNALKFTPRGGTVHVMLVEHGEHVMLHITDTGIGIAEEDQEKIFAKCWQGTAGKEYQGTAGLGLYLCSQIIKSHNGGILVASKPGHGSTFTVELPLLSSQHAALSSFRKERENERKS